MTGFPERLKNELVRYCNSIGNADSQISGVGRSFSNSLGDGYRSEGLKVVGYNYRQVMKYAEVLKNKLSENRRVKKLYIGNARNPEKMREFVVKVDKAKLARNNSNVNDIMWRLRSLSYARMSILRLISITNRLLLLSDPKIRWRPVSGRCRIIRYRAIKPLSV